MLAVVVPPFRFHEEIESMHTWRMWVRNLNVELAATRINFFLIDPV